LTDVPFPLLSAPGAKPQLAGGRILNCYPEKQPATAGKPYAYYRAPGLGTFGTVPSGRFRGGVLVNNTFYGVFGTAVYSFTSAGGAGTLLPGAVPGSEIVFAVRNNAVNPDVVFVSPGNGAFWINGSNQVVVYPDANVGQPNAVVFHKGFFIFTYGNGRTLASNVNVTTINALNNATAESKPDTLYRPVPLGNGQLLLCGSSTIEVWGGQTIPAIRSPISRRSRAASPARPRSLARRMVSARGCSSSAMTTACRQSTAIPARQFQTPILIR
jgi:hypothetical protein